MPKVGRFVADPRAGAYCQIALDTGDKVIVNHDKGGFRGGVLTIDRMSLADGSRYARPRRPVPRRCPMQAE